MNDPHVRSCMAGAGLAANLVGAKPRASGRTVLDALVTRCRALTDRQRDATSPLGRWMSIQAQFLCTSSPWRHQSKQVGGRRSCTSRGFNRVRQPMKLMRLADVPHGRRDHVFRRSHAVAVLTADSAIIVSGMLIGVGLCTGSGRAYYLVDTVHARRT